MYIIVIFRSSFRIVSSNYSVNLLVFITLYYIFNFYVYPISAIIKVINVATIIVINVIELDRHIPLKTPCGLNSQKIYVNIKIN